MMEIDNQILKKANEWLNGSFDAETKKEVQYLLEKTHQNLRILLVRILTQID